MESWPTELDAVSAAPLHHRVLFENELVRVLETIIEAGAVVPLHTHRFPSVNHFHSSAEIVRRDANGEITFDSKAAGVAIQPGDVRWNEPLEPHTLENVGPAAIVVYTTEIKAVA